MKKLQIISIIFISVFFLSLAVSASDKGNRIDRSGRVGEKIHESSVQGYRIVYHLLDLPGRAEYHLMAYIIDLNGQPVSKAKIGYLIVGPKGAKQKVMAMGMKDAFGGDVNFTAKGKYIINTKALIGDKKVLDRFTYEVK
jgi:hypothetical protein